MTTRLQLCLLQLIMVKEVLSDRVRDFPQHFWFGASTAAYHIEGGWNEGGRGPSIWDTASHAKPSKIANWSMGDVSANSFHRYKRDVEIVSELGLDFYRFSISWSRVLPDGFADTVNEKGIAYYTKLIDELQKATITPFVTMYHWDMPESLQKLGGWTNPNIVNWFADYAKVLFNRLGPRVKFWITISGPKQICYDGYGAETKAPFLNLTGIAEYFCTKHVLLAHARVYRLYHEQYRHLQNGSVGIAVNCTWYEPLSDNNPDSRAAQYARMVDWGQFTHPIFSKTGDFPEELRKNYEYWRGTLGYPKSRLMKLTSEEVDYIKSTADFFGLNSYTTRLAYSVPSHVDHIIKVPNVPQAKSSWLQNVPWGMQYMLNEIRELYDNPPVYVMENGWSTAGGLFDNDRISYIRGQLGAILDAISAGCDVRAYMVWSLIDGFEWTSGYTEKFGLYEVDFQHYNRNRRPRKSARVYKEIVRSRKLDLNYEPDMVDYMVQSKTDEDYQIHI